MTAAYDYEDLHHLVDRLTPAQARRLRLLVAHDDEFAAAVSAQSGSLAGVLALIGTVDGPEDLAERHDQHVRQRLRPRPDPA